MCMPNFVEMHYLHPVAGVIIQAGLLAGGQRRVAADQHKRGRLAARFNSQEPRSKEVPARCLQYVRLTASELEGGNR
jgi:hypothetical protein